MSDPRTPAPLSADWFLRARLKLRHLSLFVALDEHRNLHRAAASLRLSQPSASKMLGEVERALGVPLFERLPRGVEPTGYGEIVIRHARSVVAELDRAGEELGARIAGDGGTVAIGAVAAPAITVVAPAVVAVQSRFGRLGIAVEVDSSDRLIARLAEAKLDFVIARIPHGVDAAPFDYEEVCDEEIVVLVREGHRLLAGEPTDLAALAEATWVLQPRGSLLRGRLEAAFRRAGVAPPNRVIETGSTMMGIATVAQTDAVTATARSVADLFGAGGSIRVLPLGERLTLDAFGLVRLKRRPLSPGAQLLYAAVRERLLPDEAAQGGGRT
jgi:DNA-binding transcriptional LysR family regulator